MCDIDLPESRFAEKACNPENAECIERSKQAFRRVTDWDSFCKVWAQFYTGQIAIPTYGGTFVGTDDNRLANRKDASKLVNLTETGTIVIFDSQSGSPADRQKAYVQAFARDKETARMIVDEMNRYSGIFAYATRVENKSFEEIIEPLVPATVTYDDRGVNNPLKPLTGRPYTRQWLFTNSDEAEMVFDWVDPQVRRSILRKILYHVVIIDTIFTRKDYLLKTLCEVVNMF